MTGSGGRPAAMEQLHHLSDAEVAAYLDRALDSLQRQRVEAHVDVCRECRAELVALGRVALASKPGGKAAGRRLTRRWWVPVAAAAGIAAIFVLPRLATVPVGPDETARTRRVLDSEGRGTVGLVFPAGDTLLPRAPTALTWHATGADVYRVSILAADGTPLWSDDVTDTSVTLPDSVTLPAGRAYFWHVDAISRGITATGRQRFRIAP